MATWSSTLMLTLWLSIASGGSVFSSGISKPCACTDPLPARTAAKRYRRRRMGYPFPGRSRFSRYYDETTRESDCLLFPGRGLLHSGDIHGGAAACITVQHLKTKLAGEEAR